MCGARARVRSRIRPTGPSGRGAPDPAPRDTGAGAHLAAAARPPSPCRAACWRTPPPRGARSSCAADLRLNSRSAVFSRSRTRGVAGFMTALPKSRPGRRCLPGLPCGPGPGGIAAPPAAYRAGQAACRDAQGTPLPLPRAHAPGRSDRPDELPGAKAAAPAQLPPCGIRRLGNRDAREFRAVRRAGPRRPRKGGIMRGRESAGRAEREHALAGSGWPAAAPAAALLQLSARAALACPLRVARRRGRRRAYADPRERAGLPWSASASGRLPGEVGRLGGRIMPRCRMQFPPRAASTKIRRRSRGAGCR